MNKLNLSVVALTFISLLMPISAYAYDDVLTNGKFDIKKASKLSLELDRPINCSNISRPNSIADYLTRTRDALSDAYSEVSNVYGNMTDSDVYDKDNLTSITLHLNLGPTQQALYSTL